MHAAVQAPCSQLHSLHAASLTHQEAIQAYMSLHTPACHFAKPLACPMHGRCFDCAAQKPAVQQSACCAVNAGRLRTEIRHKYNIRRGPIPDWMVHTFCCSCGWCQEAKELQVCHITLKDVQENYTIQNRQNTAFDPNANHPML